jgi:hypothetical protein
MKSAPRHDQLRKMVSCTFQRSGRTTAFVIVMLFAAIGAGFGRPTFGNPAFNLNGGDTFTGNIITDGIGRRRLQFGLKLIF